MDLYLYTTFLHNFLQRELDGVAPTYRYVPCPCLCNREPAVDLPEVVRVSGPSPPDFVVHLLSSDWSVKISALSLVGCQVAAGNYCSSHFAISSTLHCAPQCNFQVCSGRLLADETDAA